MSVRLPSASCATRPDVMTRRAIIAGAGISGLSTALALSNAGLNVTIYERAKALEEYGAGLQLTPNATRVLARLGVLDSVAASATVPRSIIVTRGSDDATLMRIALEDAGTRWGAPYLAIHRADLQDALARAVRILTNVKLELNTTVVKAANSAGRVSARLERAAPADEDRADLLVGADGLRSCIRQSLGLGDLQDAFFTGRVAFRASVPAGDVDSRCASPDIILRLGPNAHLVHYPLRRGSIINLVAVIESGWRGRADDHSWNGEADRAALDRAFASWSKATRKLLATASWRAWPLYARSPINSFSTGRIALVGDAAHPMVPFLAQGAAQAIEDAGALGRNLARASDVADALMNYSRERVTRARRVQIEAQRQGRIYHMDGLFGFARDTAMRLLGPRILSSRYDWLYGS